MERDLMISLVQWRDSPARKPLIIRGARQVGKSWLIRTFGKQFEHFIELNFEKDKNASKIFPDTIDIPTIVKDIYHYTKIPARPGKTLLFLDEIQECENALRCLRYFKEDFPELHVIAAGSLLDFAIEKIGVPVGRIQFQYLYPLSFAEFLTALDRNDLRQYLYEHKPTPIIHEKLLDYLKIYFLTGGMPDVVSAWIQYGDAFVCQEIQDAIIETYRQDIPKYASKAQIEHVSTMFDKVPKQLGKKFIYSHVDETINHYNLKQALELLRKAGIVHLCYHTSGQGHPLTASINSKKFKAYFFDTGLAQRILGLDIKEWLVASSLPQHNGSIAEQFVAQQLIAHTRKSAPAELFYWHREAKSSNAEVDFVIIKDGDIVPIEVKSGNRGHIKSMQSFLDSHENSKYGIKISSNLYGEFDSFQQLPFYAIESFLC